MRTIDLDRFLMDLRNECCDICNTDPICPLYSEFGYSYELIERIAESQIVHNSVFVKED